MKKVLLIGIDAVSKKVIRPMLMEKIKGKIIEVDDIQDGIETFEKNEHIFSLVICRYSRGLVLLKCLLELLPKIPCVLIMEDRDQLLELLKVSKGSSLDIIHPKRISDELGQYLDQLAEESS